MSHSAPLSKILDKPDCYQLDNCRLLDKQIFHSKIVQRINQALLFYFCFFNTTQTSTTYMRQ